MQTFLFTLDNLPDSFRYDRTVSAYGVNGGVEQVSERAFSDYRCRRPRPSPVPPTGTTSGALQPDLRFATLADDPLPPLRDLVVSGRAMGSRALVRSSP